MKINENPPKDLRKTSTYISIQILYTVLAILLMIYHATQHYNISGKSLFNNFFLFGEIGEDMLFILMGFAIFYTSYHFIEQQNGYKEFMIRTLTRIYVTYWIIIAIPGFIVWFFYPEIHSSISRLTADTMWQTFSLWFGHPRIAIITWVLSHVVFFTLLFGLAILSKKFIILWFVVLLISFVNLIDRVFIGSQIFGEELLNRIFSPHNLEFAFGAIAYFYIKKGFRIQQYKLFLFFSVGLFLFVGMLHSYTELNFYNDRVLIFGSTALLLIIAVINYGYYNEPPINNIFYKLGEAEYIMLMIHGPILSIVNFKIATHYSFGWIFTLATLFIILVISYFIRIKIEEPFLNSLYKKMLTNKNK